MLLQRLVSVLVLLALGVGLIRYLFICSTFPSINAFSAWFVLVCAMTLFDSNDCVF